MPMGSFTSLFPPPGTRANNPPPASAAPSARDIAVFYEGTDGLFRYLFLGFTDDKKARVPIADGITHIVGVGSQRRFNEFFAVSGDEFCMFEYSFEAKGWQKVS